MEEEKYKKEMRSLEKIKAPDDFLNQVIARLDRVSVFERIKQFLFVPARLKVPLEIAAALTTIIVIFSVYKISQPSGQITYMAPKAKMQRALKKDVLLDKAKVSKRVAEVAKKPVPVIKEEKPIEIALLIKADKEVMAAAPGEMAMGAGSKARMEAEELETKDRSFPAPTPDSIATVRDLINNTQGNIISVDYEKNVVVLEIPSDNLAAFLAKIEELGDLEGSLAAETEKETVCLRLQIILLE